MNPSGPEISYLSAFLGGIALSFTPCVYPLIPVSVGFIGANTNGSKLRGLYLSLIYVTGVAVTYSLLGMLASLTGGFFGAVSSSPLARIIVGLVIAWFGLFMLDVFPTSLPNLIRPPAVKKKGYLSVFLVGLSSGFIVSPCITPVLGSILFYLATKQNVFYGASVLFCFAYGMGTILVLAGTFSNLLMRLPKSGRWMLYMKKAWALVLVAIGAYFVYNGIRRI